VTINPKLLPIFSEVVAITSAGSMDAYGKYTYGTATSHQAHLVRDSKIVYNTDGREVVQIGKAYLYGDVAVTTSSRIVLADGTIPLIISVEKPNDLAGVHHTVLQLGKG